MRLSDGDHSLELGKHKLNSSQQMELVERLAWHWRPLEIVAYMNKVHNIRISPLLPGNYSRTEKWKPVIQKLRDEYHKNLTEVPLANKRKRLDELQMLYEKAIDSRKFEEAKSLIGEFRDEMERKLGDVSLSFTSITNNEFNDLSDEDLIREKAKTIEQLEKVRKIKLLSDRGVKNAVRS